jgi:hypothetical protein
MANKGAVIGVVAVATIAALFLTKKAGAVGEYYCPYDNAGPFATIEELQQYEITNFPGQRISIEINWS